MKILETLSKGLATTISAVFLATMVLFGSSFIIAFPVEWLWNYVMPSLFSLKSIDYWQAFCLLVLTGFLFRSRITRTETKTESK